MVLRIIGILAFAVSTMVCAQDRHTVRGAPSALPMESVGTGLYRISGAGGNTVVRLTGAGIILVNGKPSGYYTAIVKNLKRYAFRELATRVLVLTDPDKIHTGTDARFLHAGIPIIAQENTKKALAARAAPSAKALPTFTFDKSRTIRMGGVTVELLHFGAAHTNGDTVVYFPALKTVDVGDLYTSSTPDVDFADGGNLVDWGGVLGRILQLDFSEVIPAKGGVIPRAALKAFKIKIDTLISRATALVNRGVPKNELMAQLNPESVGWHFDFNRKQINIFYSELKKSGGQPVR